MSNLYSKLLIASAMAFAFSAVTAPEAAAWDVSAYTDNSRLSTPGPWVKIAVSQNGIHYIPASQLRSWGFDNWQQVKVFGYGGKRLSDNLVIDNYVDDLPMVQSVTAADGIYFWAQGPLTWVGPDEDGYYHHKLNPYSTKGYYFLNAPADAADARDIPVSSGTPLENVGGGFTETFMQPLWHEVDAVSPGETGHLLVGEDFRTTTSQTFSFDLPGRVEGEPVNSRVSFFTYAPSAAPTLRVMAGGTTVSETRLPRTVSSTYGDSCLIRDDFPLTGNKLQLGLNFTPPSGKLIMANLNYININYERHLDMAGLASLEFATSGLKMRLKGAGAQTVVWDVTDPLNITAVGATPSGNTLEWAGEFGNSERRYVAWNPSATAYPCPEYVGAVASQNLHAEEVPDMVIFSPSALVSQAERLATLHRAEPENLRVLVIEQQKAFNEFGSGTPDVGALRRCLKMFYDRGADADGHKLRYALMFSRPLFDHRGLTNTLVDQRWEIVPQWQTDNGNDESYSFGMDDITVMLEDGSGVNLGNDKLSIAVGRMPVRTLDEARNAVEKLSNYVNKTPEGDWKNRMVILADDQDNGIHLEQAEDAVKDMLLTDDGSEWLYRKVYVDAYEKLSGVCEGARIDMYKWLNEGAAWWMYIGHASRDTWTGEGILLRNDLYNNLYFARLPILYAATCNFARWDSSFNCGMEIMWNNQTGGAIAGVCPTRPVYISSNGVFTRLFAQSIHYRDPETNRFLTVAEVLRRAKNLSRNDTNRLRYTFYGDPAMRMPTPELKVVLTTINGTELNGKEMPEIEAHSTAVFEGYVADSEGGVDATFNGTVYLTLYDAEYSITTLGRGDDTDPGKKCIFEQQGTKLYAGRAAVKDGRWKVEAAMPSEIAWNYRPAAVNLYAIDTTDKSKEAKGYSRDLYVYGYNESGADDTEAPVIRSLYLNHEKFVNGGSVNETPTLFASVSDNVGINLSQAGVGHTLYVKIDNEQGYTDVNEFYTPSSDGSPSGTVKYPIPELKAGYHTLTFRVWDTSNNYAEQELEFFVIPGLAPEIFDIWTDSSPASIEANFYISHNRPDAILDVTVNVYDLMGRPVWTGQQKGRSDEFTSAPLRWNLNDMSGNRVARGIYIYKATVSTDGEQTTSKSQRMAVAAH